MDAIWNEVFITGKVEKDMPRAWAVATALEGWANCHAGAKNKPENFGKGMASLVLTYSLPALQDGLMSLANSLTPADYENYTVCP